LKSPDVWRIFTIDLENRMANPFLDVLRARANALKSKSGVIVPSGNGVNANSLDLALARCATAEANLESARATARAAAKASSVPIAGLFQSSRFVNRSWAERIADEARAEGRDEMIALYKRLSEPPTPEEKAMGDAVRAAVRAGGFKSILGKDKGAAAVDDLDAAEAEAAAKVEEEAKARAELILRAAALRDSGGPPLPEPAPGSKAARILAAGRKAHQRQGDD
jgi:hypothetical protein